MATAFESDVVRLTDFRANPDSMGRGKAIGMSVRSLRLQRNRTYALVSASGRGKSVFLSLLAGFPPFAWQNAMRWSAWEVFGKNILPPDGKRRNSFSPLFPIDGQNAIIYLPQTFPQDRAEDLPALEAMAFVLCVGGSAKSLAEARELVREVACAEPFVLSAKNLDQPLHQLSGGERRRLELATRLTAIYPRNNASPAASGRRALILLDEPTTGLDVLSETRFQLFLYELVEKAHSNGTEITTVVATHAFAHLVPDLPDSVEVLVLDRDEQLAQPRPPPSMIRLVFQGSVRESFEHFAQFAEGGKEMDGWRSIIEILERRSSPELERAFFDESNDE